MRHVLGPGARRGAVRRAAREAFRNVCRYYADIIRLPRTDPARCIGCSICAQKCFTGAIAMREDFMKARPDIVEAWLKTELEAQRFIIDPKNAAKVAEIVKGQTTGITVPMAWFSLYGAIPASAGGSKERDEKPFVFDERVRKLFGETYVYLHNTKAIDVDKPAPGALDDTIARKVAKDAKATLPLGRIMAQDVSKSPK